ncbi:MAG: hypothetical protein J2P44_11760 [Candidatus Dormibacteraeota bacterium]|nr:hypothetical protein [Candidatus Dormibacteraeota bacterium]
MLFSLDQVASLGNELQELHVDQEIIHTISADLTRNSDEVTNSGFETMHVSQTVFGESAVGGSLGYHHSLAHAKVADTLAAVLEDLHAFRLGLQAFQKAVDSADTQSASDLLKRHSAIDALARSADFAHTHQRNHYYHPAGGTHA